MKSLLANRFLRSRYLVAAIGGLLWSGAFPPLDMAGLAWVAPGMLAVAALGKRGGEAFRIGYVGGLAHYLSMLYWLLLIPYRWQGLPLAPAAGWVALSAFSALFPAAWVWLILSPKSRVQDVEPASDKTDFARLSARTGEALRGGIVDVLARSWLRRTAWTLAGAAVWVAWEMFLARVFGGFPWDLLGVSQHQLVPLIQIASVTGVYGISFLVVWLSLALLSAGLTIIFHPGRSSAWVGEVFIPVLVVAILFNAGLGHLHRENPAARTLKVTMVQPSIPQTVIWDATADLQRFDHLVQWSDQILSSNPTDLLIWPESAVPKMVRYDTNTFNAITNLAGQHHTWIIVGSDDAEPRAGAANPDETDYFNSAFLVSPAGDLRQRYIKRNLVIFGEYVPLANWLPFLKWFTPVTGGYKAGSHPVQFSLGSLDVKTAVLICFEDVFPHLARTDVDPDTDFLVNLTNDGWFGEAAEQWQHGFSSTLRAVENGVPLVRCTNNGLTCWVDEYGRVRENLRDGHGTIYGPGFLTVELPILARGQTHALTFYTRHGDWFGWTCVAVGILVLLARLIRSPKAGGQNPKP